MYRMVLLVPDESLLPVAESVFQEDVRQNGIDPKANFHYSIHVAKNIRDIPKTVLEADVVISRGVISAELKRLNPGIPLVEVPIGSEMAATVMKAVRNHGNLPVAVIGFFNMCYAAYGVRDIVDVDVKPYLQESREDAAIRSYVDTALAEGRRILVCGPVTYRYAATRDCFPYVLGMSRESMLDAITRAKGEMVARRRERERAAQFQAMLVAAHEGVIATDVGGRITAINSVASAILGVTPAKALDSFIHDFMPEDTFTGDSCTTRICENVVEIGGTRISMHRSGVMPGGELLGFIITLQKASV